MVTVYCGLKSAVNGIGSLSVVNCCAVFVKFLMSERYCCWTNPAVAKQSNHCGANAHTVGEDLDFFI